MIIIIIPPGRKYLLNKNYYTTLQSARIAVPLRKYILLEKALKQFID